MHKKDIKEFTQNILWIINRQYKKLKRICPECGRSFTRSRSDNFFCSRSCYSRYHRIPGMIRKLIKGGID